HKIDQRDFHHAPPIVQRLVATKSPACRNWAFSVIQKEYRQVDFVITLDDDTLPYEDTIADHIHALKMHVPDPRLQSSFYNTNMFFPRGFSYRRRKETPVVVSHGVWHGVKDWDAPTQLVLGNPDVDFYRGVVHGFM
ncbi:MAG: hypothetical protein CUN52_15530, partial [Phototrophicales bacterium]